MPTRAILTPMCTDVDLAVADGPLTFWKQVLPVRDVEYKDKSTGKTRILKFDPKYLGGLVDAFHARATEKQTMFQLATPTNAHGHDYDPERQRGEALDMVTADKLPENVKAQIIKAHGSVPPGLYAKIKFFDDKAAKAVTDNPKLGVSARIREVAGKAGEATKAAIVHVLGTIDPVIGGMAPWASADLSYDPGNETVLDLSNSEYAEADVPKQTDKPTEYPSQDEIEKMTDEELATFIEEHADAFAEALAGEDADGDGDENDSDGEDADEEEHEEEGQPVTASLSAAQKRQIDLANDQARTAAARATDALKRMAAAEWKAYRTEMVGKGVPPADLDLAEPLLNRPDDMVVDLSTTGDEDVNIAEIVRKLLASREGTIDLSSEKGHSAPATPGDDDPDKATLDAWEAQFGA